VAHHDCGSDHQQRVVGRLVARHGGFEDAVLAKHVTWIGAIALIHATSRWFSDPQSWIFGRKSNNRRRCNGVSVQNGRVESAKQRRRQPIGAKIVGRAKTTKVRT
jgi:hypothetical protein